MIYFDSANNPAVATNGEFIIINCFKKNTYRYKCGSNVISNQTLREFLIKNDNVFFYRMKYSASRLL